jgi:hypothetical protein
VEGTEPQQTTPQRVEDSIGSGVDAILAAAKEAAAGIVGDAKRRADESRLAVEAYADRVRQEAEQEAKRIRTAAQAEGEHLHTAAHETAQAEAEALAAGNSELRNEANVLASRRDRILRELEALAHDVEDAITEVAPARPDSSLGEALDVRHRS